MATFTYHKLFIITNVNIIKNNYYALVLNKQQLGGGVVTPKCN